MPGRGWANGKGLGVEVGVGASAGTLDGEGSPCCMANFKNAHIACFCSLRLGLVPGRVSVMFLLHVNIILVFLLCCYGPISDVEVLEICPFCREDFRGTDPREG